ncbi:MAG: Gfo/Idh/MocA family protein [Anaerolineae bacterium]|jgi:predicted dehydrogenase|nr:Gfo/Idh/MocA family oxidoreductase [Chloroflexota bacterium]
MIRSGMAIGVWSLEHMHAQSYLSALTRRQDLREVRLYDSTQPELVARLAAELPLRVVSSEQELLDGLDGVIITSANASHREMALQAAEAGVPALVEKPIATTVEDAQTMVEAFQRAGLVLGTAFPCPFSPAFCELLSLKRAGALGDLLAIRATNRGSMPGGFFIELERSGGGAVIDHTVHVADLLRRLTGSNPTRVYAEVGHGLYHQSWDDSALLSIEMGDGSFATLDCSWSRPRSYPTWGDVNLRVIGSRTTAEVRLFDEHLTHYPWEATPARWVSWGTDLDAAMIDDFMLAVRNGGVPRSTGEDGLWALRVALAAYQSARTGAPVTLD